MMQFDRKDLASNARLLYFVSSVVVFVYLLAGAGLGIYAGAFVESKGGGHEGAIIAGVVVFIFMVMTAALLVAPLRLVVGVALCAAKIEENTARTEEHLRPSVAVQAKPTSHSGGGAARVECSECGRHYSASKSACDVCGTPPPPPSPSSDAAV